MSVIKGNFGEEDKPTAVDCLEEFLDAVTVPASEEYGSENVDAVVIQLDERGISLGSNLEETAKIVLLLELAKQSLLERFLGYEEGPDGKPTYH